MDQELRLASLRGHGLKWSLSGQYGDCLSSHDDGGERLHSCTSGSLLPCHLSLACAACDTLHGYFPVSLWVCLPIFKPFLMWLD